VFEVFVDFGISDQIPLPYLVQWIGRQREREFSISSSFSDTSADLTVAITEYETKFQRKIIGVCSGWFKRSEIGIVVPCWLKKGTMTFYDDKPLIMVGPGTGIAAFRAAI